MNYEFLKNLSERHNFLWHKKDKSPLEETEFEILCDIDSVIGVIKAFENNSRIITRDYDLSELKSRLDSALKGTRLGIKRIKAIKKGEL